MQAVMLAAGMGKRLAQFTQNNTKCMVEVAGKKLIDHAIEALLEVNIKRFVIVTGYQAENLENYVKSKYGDKMELVFVRNKDYATTNNIYSFFLAKSELIEDDTILLESDLIYDHKILKDLVNYPAENVVAVAKYESWMDGTVVTLRDNDTVKSFIGKENFKFEEVDKYYKTANIYKFSEEFIKNTYFPFLEAYMNAYGMDSYYETILKLICKLPTCEMKAYKIKNLSWYEIDDEQDLRIADILFRRGKERYDNLMKTYGGFWRYPGYIDFCYLVNPYFPKSDLIDKFKFDFPNLLRDYPSGLSNQSLNASRIFGVKKEHILVGNGAAELINALGHVSKGKVAVNYPTFNEYFRCFKNAEVTKIDNSKNDYALSVKSIKDAIKANDIVIIVNPENPSGFMLSKEEVIDLVKFAKENNTRLVVDESFVDFACKEERYTLLENEILDAYENLVVVKSISKSYGIPGLRLGIIATSDVELLSLLKDDMQVWNINSFGEYYLQNYTLFKKDYLASCDLIASERERVYSELSKIKSIKVYRSSANYLMVDLGNISSTKICVDMLDSDKLILKDLSTKNGFEGKNFIRVAIRDTKDNDIFLETFKKYLKK